MTGDLGTLLLQARQAHIAATEARAQWLKASTPRVVFTDMPDGGVMVEHERPAIFERWTRITREYGAGLQALASTNRQALTLAEDHFKRAVAIAAGRE